MKRKTIAAVLIGLVLTAAGCGSDVETRNMEQIYADEGVPVTTKTVAPTLFSSFVVHKSVLTGVHESSAYAAVSDKIARVHYKVGDFVEKDAIVVSFPTDSPTAQYHQAKASYDNAKALYGRMESYYEAGGLSRQEFENAEASFEVAKANWDAIRQSVKVKAPISGIITRINVRESDNVRKDDELFAVSQVDRLKAKLWVSDKQIADIRKGVSASARWNGYTLEGSVVEVDMSMNQQHKAFGVVAEFENPGTLVKYGVTADIEIETYQNVNAIVVETKDILTDESGKSVFVAVDGVARKKPVSLGKSSGIEFEILSGLVEGDELITEGQMHLEDGKKIRLIESAVNASYEETH